MSAQTSRDWTMEDLLQAMTEPCFRHFEADAQVGWTIASANQLANYVSHLFMSWAEHYIRVLPRSDANFEASVAWRAESKKAHDVAIRSEQLNLQIQLTRVVGSFLSYLSETISLVFLLDPTLLSPTDRAQYEAAQGLPDQEERLRGIVEKRVASLSFGGSTDIQKYVETVLDFQIFDDSAKAEEVGRAISERNLIVHNRAKVDAKFLQRMCGHTTLKHGDPLVLEQQAVSRQAQLLRLAVGDIDARASAKFALPRPITEEQFYERVQIPFFIGDWRSTFNDDDPLLAEDPDNYPAPPS